MALAYSCAVPTNGCVSYIDMVAERMNAQIQWSDELLWDVCDKGVPICGQRDSQKS